MKRFFRKTVLWILKVLAKKRIKKFKGKVIAVTGSLGKTSTKDAIFSVLNTQFKVKKSEKSMNSEFGLLCTILDIDSGYSSIVKWSVLLVKAFYHSLFKDFSEVLLVEMGVDKPKDMNFLLSILKPDIAIITNICPVHMSDGQFSSMEDIFNEKSKLVEALKEDGIAILNYDNPYLETLAKSRKKSTCVTYGLNEKADCFASEIVEKIEGISFTMNYKKRKYPIQCEILGEYQVYTLMPAIICAGIMGMDMENAINAISKYSLPPGRMSVIEGINDSMILDSSYNSSPEALKTALKTLSSVGSGKRRVAVLGNMNELGIHSKTMHEIIGDIIPSYVDFLVTVGEDAKLFATRAIGKGMDEKNVINFVGPLEASAYMKDKITRNDVILVKGSQNNVRLEKFIKEIMAKPQDASKILARQEKEWSSIN